MATDGTPSYLQDTHEGILAQLLYATPLYL